MVGAGYVGVFGHECPRTGRPQISPASGASVGTLLSFFVDRVVASKRAPKADSFRPVQELAETVDLIVVAAPGKTLQFPFEIRKPRSVSRKMDKSFLDRGTGRVETDFLIFGHIDGNVLLILVAPKLLK